MNTSSESSQRMNTSSEYFTNMTDFQLSNNNNIQSHSLVCSLGEPVLVERHDSGAEQAELAEALRDYAGRETPLYHAERLSEYYKSINNGKGPDIYLKREDLNHGGSHKMNNALAQAMIAKRMGCKSVVTATSFGQHDLATAVACAKLALECMIFMANFALKVMNNEFLLSRKKMFRAQFFLLCTPILQQISSLAWLWSIVQEICMCCDRGGHTRVSRNKQLGRSCELFHSFMTRKQRFCFLFVGG
ncbi:hypothetical protein VIGAN_01221800 [Vigna angularis var. angularis]|uniref:tryptophan synthase n=1 Tax=Vigna angularis var. angularis TaxID=157739 RepID=A0A0S3R1T1_PHAAN|nr:hypothetical protein VIGAN_01221800 [Vigna angularis var. angularis]